MPRLWEVFLRLVLKRSEGKLYFSLSFLFFYFFAILFLFQDRCTSWVEFLFGL